MHNIGVIGYSSTDFDEQTAKDILQEQLDGLDEDTDEDICVVSGWTALGVPKLAYEIADAHGWETMGVACEKAYDHPRHSVDTVHVVGDDWGDESDKFLSVVDEIIRIGGGDQTKAEANEAENRGIPVQTTLLD